MVLINESILENEIRSARSQSMENWLWKDLWTCKADCEMNELTPLTDWFL
jgi:hypothetical protein